MTWRSVAITRPAHLSFKNQALVVRHGSEKISVPIEDIAVIVIDTPQALLTSKLLSACAGAEIVMITVDSTHMPNGILMPYQSHSRALKIMRLQLSLSVPVKKRMWQSIVRQKLKNQSAVLALHNKELLERRLLSIAEKVRSGDSTNLEAQGARLYFPALFGAKFNRAKNCFYNAALNYCYSIVRSAIARSLVAHGFLPAFGLNHSNELNAFNLADDLIEPYRPLVDAWVLENYPKQPERELLTQDKAILIGILHQDALYVQSKESKGCSTVLALIDATAISLLKRVQDTSAPLVMPEVLQL